ncbi:MAG: protein kinase domain-containing protein, partial [Pseudanabaena sp.]
MQAAILMTARDRTVVDHNGRDIESITFLDHRCIDFFQSDALIPDDKLTDIRDYIEVVKKVIQGKTQPKSAPQYYRDWLLEQRLGGSDRFEEYRTKHKDIPALYSRLRVYQAEAYADLDSPDLEKERIRSTFRTLRQIKHPNIQGVSEFFETEDGDRFILVLDEIEGRSLRQAVNWLSTNQKFYVLNQVLGAMGYAHEHGIIHRNLSPDNIMVTHNKGKVIITGFEYARNRDRTHTIADEIIDSI